MNYLHPPTKPSRFFSGRTAWLAAFVLVNLICMGLILSSGELLGEAAGFKIKAIELVVPMTVIVVMGYILILGVAFPLLCSIKVTPAALLMQGASRASGITLFLLQLGFIYFFTSTGTFGAGSTTRSESVWSMFWVFVSVDSLFFIYYGFFRESKLFYPNLLIAIASNLLRGWTGVFLVIAFMESARLIRSGRLTLSKVAFFLTLSVLAYPLLYAFKLQIRFAFTDVAADLGIVDVISTMFSSLNFDDFVDLLLASLTQIVERLHLVSNSLFVYQNSDALAEAISAGQITPFWMEGLYGLAYERFFNLQPTPNLGVAVAQLIDPLQVEVNWNSNPGYGSWFFVMPYYGSFYLVYTLGMVFMSIWLVKRMKGNASAFDMLWFACLSYVLPGWIASYVLFLHSLFLFYLFQVLVTILPSNRQSGHNKAQLSESEPNI